MNINVPETRSEAINLVVRALITRNNNQTMHDGPNVVHLTTLHALFDGTPELLKDFEQIVKEGALSFAMMGFVPVSDSKVDMDTMTLTIHVDDPGSSIK